MSRGSRTPGRPRRGTHVVSAQRWMAYTMSRSTSAFMRARPPATRALRKWKQSPPVMSMSQSSASPACTPPSSDTSGEVAGNRRSPSALSLNLPGRVS
ncbi:hypothetical protein TRAPUB_11151 [Trametes pubescens]|uniref:Uncharacterized protein n=1 Tax=Trametes pubescens TaxID=154538 RepID=A0A1M2VXE3_TRAPU|nr:hypothetical protein TRAPUB_11151 [Trametes pubescens]